jgi:hypothetical protein
LDPACATTVLPLCCLLFVAQRAPQDLADVGLRQFVAELDVLRFLVAGELRLQ